MEELWSSLKYLTLLFCHFYDCIYCGPVLNSANDFACDLEGTHIHDDNVVTAFTSKFGGFLFFVFVVARNIFRSYFIRLQHYAMSMNISTKHSPNVNWFTVQERLKHCCGMQKKNRFNAKIYTVSIINFVTRCTPKSTKAMHAQVEKNRIIDLVCLCLRLHAFHLSRLSSTNRMHSQRILSIRWMISCSMTRTLILRDVSIKIMKRCCLVCFIEFKLTTI